MNSPIPYFIFSALMILAGWGICLAVPFYKNNISAAKNHRFRSLDGLRGFLAFGVLVHHAICYYSLTQEKAWYPRTEFYNGLGSHYVSLFFMITGFLFWSKIIKTKGRLPIREFIRSRIGRILPMYYCSAVLVLILIGYKTNWTLLTTSSDLAREIFRICLGGWSGYGEINKSGNNILNGVYWTLKLEWRFYLFLPFIARLVYGSRIRTGLLIIGVILLCQLVTHEVQYFQFVLGGLAAEIVERAKWKLHLQSGIASAVAALLLVFTFVTLGASYSWIQSICLGLFFVCIAAGNSLFGILLLPGSIFLGVISYSVYLIHMSLLYICFTYLLPLFNSKSFEPVQWWLFIVFCGLVVLIFSSLSFRYVESPFILKNKKQTT